MRTDWIPFQEVDFNDESIHSFHIDTRDFNCLIRKEANDFEIDLSKTKKNPEIYFHTGDEIKKLIERYFAESGGNVQWRMFCLTGEATYRTSNWQLKYIRIYRFPQGLIIASRRNENESAFIFNKRMLACDVDQKWLNAH